MTTGGLYLASGRCAAPGCTARPLSERPQRPIRDSTNGRGISTTKATVGVRVCAAGHEQRNYYT